MNKRILQQIALCLLLFAYVAEWLGWLPRECQTCDRADPVSILVVALISTAISVGTSYVASLFAPKPAAVERNKQEIRITTSSYGEPIKRGYGKFACGGSVIYRGNITDNVTTTRGSGGKRRTPDTQTHSYSCSFGVSVCDARGGDVVGIARIFADDKILYSGTPDGNEVNLGVPNGPRTAAGARRFNIKLGKEDQLPNTWYEAEYGVGKVSAHRGSLTAWWDDFGLDDWFNRIPNLIFEVVKSDGRVDKIITKECQLVGMDTPNDLDVATLTQTIDGLLISSVQPPRSTIEVLSQSEQFDLVEVDGKLKGIKRPQASSVVVPWGDLGSYDGGAEEKQGESPPRVSAGIEQPFDVPRKVVVGYFEAARNYEAGSQEFGRQIYDGSSVLNFNWPLVLTPDAANKRARILAVTAWTERYPFQVSLPPTYIKYHPGDVLTIPTGPDADARTFDVRITEMDFAPAEAIKIKAVRQVKEAYSQTGKGGTSRSPNALGQALTPPLASDLWLSNVPPIVDAHANIGGIYAAVAPQPGSVDLGLYLPDDPDPDNPGGGEGTTPDNTAPPAWRGTILYRNQAGTDEANPLYEQVATFPLGAAMGRALTALPNVTGDDTTSTLRVKMSYGALSSISGLVFGLVDSVNLAILGNEILQFRDAVLVSGTTDTYDISIMRRGRRGTESQVNSHVANERFVLVSDAIQRIPLNASDKGITFNYKAVSAGQELDDVSPIPFVYEDLV